MRLWVAEGGTAIAMRGAAPWLRANTIDWVDPESEGGVAEENAAGTGEDEAQLPARLPYSDKDDFEANKVIGGAIFAADLDVSHPLGFGYASREIFLHKNVEEPLLPSTNPFATVIAYADDPVISRDDNGKRQRHPVCGQPQLSRLLVRHEQAVPERDLLLDGIRGTRGQLTEQPERQQ